MGIWPLVRGDGRAVDDADQVVQAQPVRVTDLAWFRDLRAFGAQSLDLDNEGVSLDFPVAQSSSALGS